MVNGDVNMSKNIELLLFDVNETLLDITVLEAFFEKHFSNKDIFRNWFSELVLYSQTTTLSGNYESFENLAIGVLQMIAANNNVILSIDNINEFKRELGSLPIHPDVVPALKKLKSAGYRLATLTNSAQKGSHLVELNKLFECQFSVDSVKAFKPAPTTYQYVAKKTNVSLDRICLVACHFWDTIGAQSIGCKGAFIARKNNNLFHTPNIPTPDFIALDLEELCTQLLK